MFEQLFSPIQIRGLTLKNRVILPSMGTKMASEDGYVTDRLINYHVARAEGGCGLNITEVCSVHGPSAPRKFLAMYDDCFIPKHKELCDAIHKSDGKCGIQLWQGSIAVAGDPNARVFVASDFKRGNTIIPAITKDEIQEIVTAYGEAAKRAVKAGYDFIEYHAAHNYLPHSFLSAGINHRDDEYGGSLNNRARFLLECIKAIRHNIPDDMPLSMRIDAHDDYLENGLSIDDVVEFCKMAKEEGVDILNVSRGNIITPATKYEVPPLDIEKGFNVDNATYIRDKTGMLTMAVGRINSPYQANAILEKNKADMIVMGRAQLVDPQLCNKSKSGQPDKITFCIGCNQGCYDGFVDPNRPFITCLRNPYVGKEKEGVIKQTDKAKTFLIAGGGIAGLEAASILKERGHNPIVYEASDVLGGQFILAGEAPHKVEMKAAAMSYVNKANRYGVEIHMNTPVTSKLLEEQKYDEVIIAIGAQPLTMPIEGKEKGYQANDVLAGNVSLEGSCAIIGGGLIGCEVAEYLNKKGNPVTIIESLDEIAKDLGMLRKICVMERIHASPIQLRTHTTCKEIHDDGILLEHDGREEKLEVDNVIMAIGSESRNFDDLKAICEKRNIPYHVIGDAKEARRALDAIAEANEVARKID